MICSLACLDDYWLTLLKADCTVCLCNDVSSLPGGSTLGHHHHHHGGGFLYSVTSPRLITTESCPTSLFQFHTPTLSAQTQPPSSQKQLELESMCQSLQSQVSVSFSTDCCLSLCNFSRSLLLVIDILNYSQLPGIYYAV